MSETAREWAGRVFAPVIEGEGEGAKIMMARGVKKAGGREVPTGAAVFVYVKTFAEMFEGVIKGKNDLKIADAIAADEGKGYASFIEAMKEKGIFG